MTDTSTLGSRSIILHKRFISLLFSMTEYIDRPVIIETVRVPVFTAEDPLLPVVKQLLGANKDSADKIRTYFATQIQPTTSGIVAVRSEDLLACIHNLLQGSVSVDSEQQAVAKKKGWYYLTPVTQNTFMSDIERNTGLYAENAAFTAAFVRNVMPVLQVNWLQQARNILISQGEYESAEPNDYPDTLVVERIIYLFRVQLLLLAGSGKSILTAHDTPLGKETSTLQDLTTLIHPSVDAQTVLQFLLSVAEERGGVVVAFNSKIMQGETVTDFDDSSEVLHDIQEIAISPLSGMVKLGDTVVAIESLGDYEDAILKELGLG